MATDPEGNAPAARSRLSPTKLIGWSVAIILGHALATGVGFGAAAIYQSGNPSAGLETLAVFGLGAAIAEVVLLVVIAAAGVFSTLRGRQKRAQELWMSYGLVLVLLFAALGVAQLSSALSSNAPLEPWSGASTTTPTQRTPRGLPALPDATHQATYIAELNAIDPDIVHGDQDAAVGRGREQCASMDAMPAESNQLISLTNQRFISLNHPQGFGLPAAEQIQEVVRRNLCPSY